MNKLINLLGNVSGILGIIVCTGAGLVRLSGHYEVAGYGTGSLLLVGTSLMVLACLAKLQLVTAGQKR
jgi:hypothetical protein